MVVTVAEVETRRKLLLVEVMKLAEVVEARGQEENKNRNSRVQRRVRCTRWFPGVLRM